MNKRVQLVWLLWAVALTANAQITIKGTVKDLLKNEPIGGATVTILGQPQATVTDSSGYFTISLPKATYKLRVSAVGYFTQQKEVTFGDTLLQNFSLEPTVMQLNEVVVSGTMKEVTKLDSPVPVEVYSKAFFRANPTPSVFESFQHVNGVRPQLNCNICNTGDIHVNGLEGPYTMVLIDGMPLVSGLSTVYGLTGIPQSLIERVEVVKGPASTLYGSEAIGGLINVITQSTKKTPTFSAEVFSSSWLDFNLDLGGKLKVGDKTTAVVGINYFTYQNPIDNNADGFTDVTLQNRVSVFNKWSFRNSGKELMNLAARYVYENRWGGQMGWTSAYRGGNEVYAESIYTNRWELMGNVFLPTKENLKVQFSVNSHHQDSFYGTTPFNAIQTIGFAQLVWDKQTQHHSLLSGLSYRYTWYDDDTPITASEAANLPSVISLPGVFLQDELTLNPSNKLLLGLRYDLNSIHGSVVTPRLNYKVTNKDKTTTLRYAVGNGYRVASVFTEDHATLTGSRQVVFTEKLRPEKSWNTNVNLTKAVVFKQGFLTLDFAGFYTYLSNRITPDYLSDPNKLIYKNLDGYAISKGMSFSADFQHTSGLKITTGGTLMDVTLTEKGITSRQLLTERFSGVWTIAYQLPKMKVTIDYTGNCYSPMLLPLLGELDSRPGSSPWYSIQNIQFTKLCKNTLELYGGLKNVLNFTPPANSIARAFDPFDKQVEFDANGQVIPTANNPNALSFDPSYVYAPNQGRRLFLGIRWKIG